MVSILFNLDLSLNKMDVHLFAYLFKEYILDSYYFPSAMLVLGSINISAFMRLTLAVQIGRNHYWIPNTFQKNLVGFQHIFVEQINEQS